MGEKVGLVLESADVRERSGDIEVLLVDDDRKIDTLTVSQEALEDYAAKRGVAPAGTIAIFHAGLSEIIAAADKVYNRHLRPKPSKIVVTTQDLNG